MDTGLEVEKIPDNGKENVFIYGGNLAQNGITTSLRSLLNTLDTDKRNYYISFCQGKAKNYAYQLTTFNPDVSFFAIAEYCRGALCCRRAQKFKLHFSFSPCPFLFR